MSVLRLAWAYLAARPLLAALHVTMLALGVATLVFLLLVSAQAEERLARDAAPVDLVVGAKGSPLQLILSSVLHADVPTGNIPLAEARRVAASPMVASAIPLALGDSHAGLRIVGTVPGYLDLYGARVAQGRLFAAPMEAVLGSHAAARTGLAPGGSFVGAHGLASASGAPLHEGEPYRVVGVLGPTGTVLDRLVLTPLESVWHVHDEHPREGRGEQAARDITAMLLRYRSPLAAATLPRQVNATTALQAASPAYEIARLMNLVGVGVEALRLFAIVMMAMAALSMFAALASALQERRYDLALLRMLGARPLTLVALLAAEGVTLVVSGVILGLAFGHVATEAAGLWLARTGAWSITGWTWQASEGAVAAAVLAAGALTSLLPAIQAYARDPALLLKR